MRVIKFIMSGVILVAFVTSGMLVVAQSNTDSILEHYGTLFSGPDEYYFFESDRKQVVDYRQDRVVRICTGDSRHLVPLKVTADERTLEIGAGDCARVEAKQIYLEPAEPLDANTMIQAEVETFPAR